MNRAIITSFFIGLLLNQTNFAQDALIYNDHYYEGITNADNNKPICIIFNGNSCENNSLMKEDLESQLLIKSLNQNFNTILLDIDSYEKITPEDKALFKPGQNYNYYGMWWTSIMFYNFKNRIAPAAIIIDKNENLLSNVYHYNKGVEFYEWIEKQSLLLSPDPNK